MAQTAVVMLKRSLLDLVVGHSDGTDDGGAAQENSAWRCCGMAQMAVVLLKGTVLGGLVGLHRWRWCC